MSQRVRALVVADELHPLESLREALRDVSVDTSSARTREEAKRLLTQTKPDLIFTTTSVSDGSWSDVVDLAEKAINPCDVIVVSPTTDVKFYLSAIERGAFDFMVPPFERAPLNHIVRSGWLDVQKRRQTLARPANA